MTDANEPTAALVAQACMAGCALGVILPVLLMAVVALGAIVLAIPGLGPIILFLVIAGFIKVVGERVQRRLAPSDRLTVKAARATSFKKIERLSHLADSRRAHGNPTRMSEISGKSRCVEASSLLSRYRIV